MFYTLSRCLMLGAALITGVVANKSTVTVEPISEALRQEMQQEGGWSDSNPLNKMGGLDALRLLTVSYYDFDGKVQEGKLIVLAPVANKFKKVFERLFELKFPIQKIELAHNVSRGEDKMLMRRNITSAFNNRMETGGKGALSPHAWGIAIDINPAQNPYVDATGRVYPKGAEAFLERQKLRKGMVEPIVTVFKDEGFLWGGDNAKSPDYHHFHLNIQPPEKK